MTQPFWRKLLGNWLLAVLLVLQLATGLTWAHTAAEAKPLSAVKEYDVTLKAPDLIVPNVFTVTLGDTIRFRVTQAGPAPHNLHIGGNGIEVESPVWPAGQTGVWDWTPLRAGIYAIYCTIGSRDFPGYQHRHYGPMEGVIVVTEPGAAAPDLSRWQTHNVRLNAVGGSGITGEAFLQPRADGSIGVRVSASGIRPGVAYSAAVYDRRGANCNDGIVATGGFMLPAVAGGPTAFLTANITPDNWGGVSIWETAGMTPLACGNAASASVGVGAAVPAGTTLAPVALPRTGDILFALVFVANAAGIVLLAAGARLRRTVG